MNFSQPVVTAIGSCRVFGPLRKMHARGGIYLNKAGIYGFVHYPKEIIQMIKVLQGDVRIPRELRPFTMAEDPFLGNSINKIMRMSDKAQKGLKATDIFVIEIGSLKEIKFLHYYLQLNHTYNFFSRFKFRDYWWDNLFKGSGDQGEIRQTLGTAIDSKLTPLQKEIVLRSRGTIPGKSSVIQDMELIKKLVRKPIIFVTHIDLLNQEFEELGEREKLAEYVAEGARLLDEHVFRPGKLISQFGQQKAMQAKGRDLYHYTDEFEWIVGEHIVNIYIFGQIKDRYTNTQG